jgi:hypothetical protein
MTRTRVFRVHARHAHVHARILKEPTFEAAAVAYAEDLAELPGEPEEISLIVRELESGHEHCFRIDLQTGEASPC